MKTQVLIKVIEIRKLGQRYHFQVNLPKNTVRIVSLHHSVRVISTLVAGMFPPAEVTVYPNIATGILTLQAFGKEGWFYNGEVFLPDRNMNFEDFNQMFIHQSYPFTHITAMHVPLEVKVNAETTIINCAYHDLWGKLANKGIQYDVKIYLTVELNPTK